MATAEAVARGLLGMRSSKFQLPHVVFSIGDRNFKQCFQGAKNPTEDEAILGRKADQLGPVFTPADVLSSNVKVLHVVGIWSGSIEIGVTALDPETLGGENVPQSATELRNGTWLMSNKTILQNGETLIENYGNDLEKLEEGDTVGLMRTIHGELVFFINKTPQGVAVPFVPAEVFVVVSLYGKCAQVSIVEAEASEQSSNTEQQLLATTLVDDEMSAVYTSGENNSENDKLRFYSRCGPLVKLSCNNRTAERKRPKDEFNNAIVLTHRPLRNDELFQITTKKGGKVVRIDNLVRKWSGSIEFGVTSHNPATFDFPATLTIMQTGTLIMSGNGILHDGKAANSPYTNFNLDQLQEGDRVGVMRKSNGEICYFINGTNLGIAISGIHHQVWGALNLYGMAAKVTIVDRNEREEHNLRLNFRTHQDFYENAERSLEQADDTLLFHPNCGFHAAVINGGRTAHRPNSTDQFNHGVVLTNRTLKANEIFEVRLDKMVTKWAGSIEIGVTTHVPTQLDYPCTMTNVRSGTWMMTGNGIMHNGTSIVDDYGQSLDRLKVGDRVGVVRKENGFLSFLINGVDQGMAATNVPENVYGVIDLYGQAAQVSIVHSSENNRGSRDQFCSNVDMENASTNISDNFPIHSSNSETLFGGDLRFHYLHGRNAKVSNNGLTASRPNALGEFNAAIVTSSRPLRDNEIFEVVIERMVDRWSGNIEAGITTIRPEELIFPNTMTDIDHAETWMLSGTAIMMGGSTVRNRYTCNLDTLTVGSRVGIQRRSDGSLHYWINGEDQGVAAYDIPSNVFCVIDLYGQCAQVSITRAGDMSMISSQIIDSLSLPLANDMNHRYNRFSVCCGKNVALKNNNLTAARMRHYTNALVFSSAPLELDEIFEVRLTEVRHKWAGSLMIGVTTMAMADDYPTSHLPPSVGGICADTWYIAGSQVRKNQTVIKENYCVNLNRLSQGDRVGLKVSVDRTLKVLINGEDMGIAAYHLPKKMFAVVDLYGSTEAVSITSLGKTILSPNDAEDSSHSPVHRVSPTKESHASRSSDNISSLLPKFYLKHGKNIELSHDDTTARRISSYNQGIVVCSQILEKNQLFEIKVGKLNLKWTSSLMIGVIDGSLEKVTFPFSALGFKKACWMICGDCVFQSGTKVKGKYGPNLDTLQEGSEVGVKVDLQDNLHLVVNGTDYGIACKVGPGKWRPIVDLYGQCEEVSIMRAEGKLLKKRESIVEQEMEKSELSNEKGEKIGGTNAGKLCEYINSCQVFKHSLCLPEPYFVASEPVVCYCEACHKQRDEQLTAKQGDPPAEYYLPVGWVKFPVNINVDSMQSSTQCANLMTSSTSSLSNVLTTWHVAYHGLKIPHVRRVMDFGQLCADNGLIRENFSTSQPKGKDEKADGDVLIFSPTIEYAGIPEFSKRYEYFDPITKRKMWSKVAFQLLVQPGSYKTGAPSYPNPVSVQPDSNGLEYEAIEWSTKEQGSAHISALLVQLEPAY